ncbi:RING/U-box superfamily protein [Striga asiatica]|uniref:RING/U-box superfamily protein n=1 Tax=Striga asiatica TaxID=4170 RepID=A0A5A7R9L5_STRAF|nr:RING/U-box superfamily protein [Striga asiatica]
MERADQSSTGGEYSGGASASATWESYEESPPLPFPERFPEFRRNYSREERFEGMNNEGALMNGGGSSATRDDPMSCFVASTTFSFFVVMTMAFGLYASETLRLGPNSSILMKPNHLFVEYIKVIAVDASKGAMLYGFYKDPPLDVKTTWSETHKITLPASTHKEWVYYLNEGSQISISYSVNSRSSSYLILVIAEGEAGLSEWLKEPSYPNITLSWNIINGTGVIQKDISDSSTYYIAVDSYYKCTPSEGQCTFKLFISSGNAAVLTSPGRSPGIVSGDWNVKLSYGPRWITYLVGTAGITFLLLLVNYFLNHFRRTEQDTSRDQLGEERNSLLLHKDEDAPSWGSSYASVSDDEERKEDMSQGAKAAKDDENKQICAICFDAPKDSFFIPCGHCAACYGCSTRVVESSGVCPICRRPIKRVRKIYTV